jgi:acyl-coenzyme A synthetase/AMP-(fatty) acid ligase
VRATPDVIARVEVRRRREYSFGELAEQSQRCAAYLQQCGAQIGTPVLVLQPLSVELYVILAALFQVGAIALLWRPGQATHQLRVLQPRIWLGWSPVFALQVRHPALRAIPHKVAIGCPVPGTTSWSRLLQTPPSLTLADYPTAATAMLSLTSGTTGEPKPIARSHQLLWAQYQALQPILHWQPGTQELTTLPLFGLAHLISGGTVVMPPVSVQRPGQVSGRKLRATLRDRAIERLVAAPGILRRLLPSQHQRHTELPNLQAVFVGGAPLPHRALAQLQQLAPNATIAIVYGATEAEPIATHRYAPRDRAQILQGAGAPAGQPVSRIHCQIWHDGDAVPQGAIGEIIVRGEHVARSPHPKQRLHWQGTDWHRTGDAGYFDRQGQLWLMGRWQARLQDERGSLYPFAVECVANECPGVARSALVQWRGERWLFVTLEPRVSSTRIRQLLHQQLAWAKLDRVILPFTIPVDARHHAKVNYPQLYRQLRHRFPENKNSV